MRRVLPFVLLLIACGSDRTAQLVERVEVERSVTFPRTFVGFPTTQNVLVTNHGRAPRTFEVRVSPPFSLTGAPGVVAGARQVPITVAFSPVDAGSFASTMVLDFEGERHEVQLTATAELPPLCEASACRIAMFDPTAGSCVEQPAPNGTACQSACLSDAVCFDGECRGTGLSCDDSNPCTADLCDPERGCVNVSSTESCPATTDPCKVPYCDPATGCGEVTAPDGTSCGATDCNSMHFCVAGQCREIPTPDGVACGSESPCQERGVCVKRVCVQPAVQEMTSIWTYAPSLVQMQFDGVSDSDGTNYVVQNWWTDSAEIVALAPDGTVKYTIRASPEVRRSSISLIAGDDLLVSNPLGSPKGVVHAWHRRTGQLAWTVSLETVAAQLGLGPAVVKSLTFNKDGHLVLLLGLIDRAAAPAVSIAVVDKVSGALLALEPLPCTGTTEMGAGGEVLAIRCWNPVETLLGTTATGMALWSTPITDFATATLRSLDGARLLTQSFAIDMRNGRKLYDYQWRSFANTSFMRSVTSGRIGFDFAYDENCTPETDSRTCTLRFVGFDAETGHMQMSVPTSETPRGVVLTSRDSLFVIEQKGIREIAWSDGKELYSCPVPFTGTRFTLQNGLLVMQAFGGIAAYQVGVKPATHGWVTMNGNFGRTNQAK